MTTEAWLGVLCDNRGSTNRTAMLHTLNLAQDEKPVLSPVFLMTIPVRQTCAELPKNSGLLNNQVVKAAKVF